MLNYILIRKIPHKDQRYDTLGDWIFLEPSGNLLIRVSKIPPLAKKDETPDGIYQNSEFLVGLHELIEAYLCYRQGTTTLDVDKFDFNFSGDEPGNDPNAPYFKEHKIAEIFERMMCVALGMTWEQHEHNLELICPHPESQNLENSSETLNEENKSPSNDATS